MRAPPAPGQGDDGTPQEGPTRSQWTWAQLGVWPWGGQWASRAHLPLTCGRRWAYPAPRGSCPGSRPRQVAGRQDPPGGQRPAPGLQGVGSRSPLGVFCGDERPGALEGGGPAPREGMAEGLPDSRWGSARLHAELRTWGQTQGNRGQGSRCHGLGPPCPRGPRYAESLTWAGQGPMCLRAARLLLAHEPELGRLL